MTGLSVKDDALIEVAALVTDGDLNVLGDGIDVIIRPPQAALDQMNPFVVNMHTESGLLPLLEDGLSLDVAEQQVLDYIKSYVSEAGKAPLAGNTIGTDRAFLAEYMATLEGYLHYRNVDVSSIKELAKRWFPRIYYNTPDKTGNHRALSDIAESIEELRFYREALFIPDPGPTSEEVKRIATKYQGVLTAVFR
jgi:oligoribonuclease